MTSQGTPPRKILFEKDGLRRVLGGSWPDQTLGGVSTSSGLEDGVGDPGWVDGGPFQPSFGGNGGNLEEREDEKLPKSLKGEAAISESEVGGEVDGGSTGKGPHLILRHLTKSSRS